MSFDGQGGISCDGIDCHSRTRSDIEYAWNCLAADDGDNYYFCTLNCLAVWADLFAEPVEETL